MHIDASVGIVYTFGVENRVRSPRISSGTFSPMRAKGFWVSFRQAVTLSKSSQPGDKTDRAAQRAASQEASRRKRAAALLSIVSNTLLVLLKLAVGYLSNSVSILSEAIHSATDLMAASIAFFSVRASDTPPDYDHPYGHGKIESLSGLAEALLILAAAVYIVFESVTKLRHPASLAPETLNYGLLVMGLSVAVNVALSRRLFQVAKETDSLALAADAEHLRTDVLTSAGVLVGLLLARLTGIAWLDPVTALPVAVLIVHASYRLSRDAVAPLLDARLPPEEEAAIQEVLETDARVLGYHKLRTRKAGSQRHADVHVQMDDNCTLIQAHDLAEELEDRIREALPAMQINIHIEPYHAELRHQQEAHGVPAPPETLNEANG